MNPLPYVLATSELTSTLSAVCGVTVRTYADDCATVFSSWRRCEPAVRHIFEDFARATGMQINSKKSVVVPLRPEGWSDIREDLETRPLHERLPMASFAKYLGLYLGPGARDESWRGPVRKMQRRLEDWAWRDAGLMTAIRIFNTYLLSTLSFVCQFLPPPEWVLQAVAKAAQQVVGGPSGAFTVAELTLLREQHSWPAPMGDLVAISRASQLRVWHWGNRHQGGLRVTAALRRIADAAANTGYIPDDPHHYLWWHTPLQRHLRDTVDTLANAGVTLRTVTACMFPTGLREDKQIRQLRRGTQRTTVRMLLRRDFAQHGDRYLRRRLGKLVTVGNFPVC
jgi:hypothetical protein